MPIGGLGWYGGKVLGPLPLYVEKFICTKIGKVAESSCKLLKWLMYNAAVILFPRICECERLNHAPAASFIFFGHWSKFQGREE